MKFHINTVSSIFIALAGILSIQQTAHSAVLLGKINFELHGMVVAYSCGVVDSETEKYIDLGKHATKSLSSAGTKSTLVPIPFDLTNCPPNGTVNITFTGNKDSINTELLAIDKNANSAKNIAIEISDKNKKRIPIGVKSENMSVDNNGNISTLFYANYIVTEGSSTAGLANANAQFTIQYD